MNPTAPGPEAGSGPRPDEDLEGPAYLGREFPGGRAPYSLGPSMYGLAFTLFFLGLVTLVFYANGNLVGAAICGLLFIGTVNVGFFAIRRQVKGVIGNNPRKYDR